MKKDIKLKRKSIESKLQKMFGIKSVAIVGGKNEKIK